jgi:hypothetical protein
MQNVTTFFQERLWKPHPCRAQQKGLFAFGRLKDRPRTVQQHSENRLAKQYQDAQQEILVRKLEDTKKTEFESSSRRKPKITH